MIDNLFPIWPVVWKSRWEMELMFRTEPQELKALEDACRLIAERRYAKPFVSNARSRP